ncbi:CYTOCHROME B561 AND DOMON DOMAIN-CONTAINING PROTEIN [Salix viminalis]|uniref:CYTOCHROME B561 AND DOMON DOMAIN-CONTAINING PROTEIN n=1 Tax=Salix viminalis TaxID=40686 RepID=A0A9Q0TNY6_SALVM|nr:CYTOCHROME B561 AND DOMON DOMAIN-CONTAINING PROTEIN [Salix viminalis]
MAEQPPPCATYRFSNNKHFPSCSDLPVLSSSLHWNYHPSSSRVDVAFRHTGVSDRRWIAWAINPTSAGMVGSQAIVSFPRTDGSLAVYTSSITSYRTRLEQGNLSFPVWDLSATNQNNEMIIYASLELQGNISAVNHLWQVGPMSENTPLMHSVAPSSPNVRSMGSLDFPFRKDYSDKKLFCHCEKYPWNIEHGKLGYSNAYRGHHRKTPEKVRICRPFMVLPACKLSTSGLCSWWSWWIRDWDCSWQKVSWNRTFIAQDHRHYPVLSCNNSESWWYAYSAVIVGLGCIALGLEAYARVKGRKSNTSVNNKCSTSIEIEEV